MLNKEDTEKIKAEIIRQIDSWQVSEEQKSSAKEKILLMSPAELEEFLKANKMITEHKDSGNTCVFCMIIQNKVKSYKIAENKECLAVLEINPSTKGHSITIPKKHLPVSELPDLCFTLAKKVAQKIKQELKPQDIKISTSSFSGHGLINIVPDYGKPQEKKKAEPGELIELQKLLLTKETEEIKEPAKDSTKKEQAQPEKAPRRIP